MKNRAQPWTPIVSRRSLSFSVAGVLLLIILAGQHWIPRATLNRKVVRTPVVAVELALSESERLAQKAEDTKPELASMVELAVDQRKDDAYLWYAEHRKETLSRVQETIEQLGAESVTESLDLLDEVDLYYYPVNDILQRGLFGPNDIPLPADYGTIVLQNIAGNRRVLKLLDELSQMPRSSVIELLEPRIHQALSDFLMDYEERVTLVRGGALQSIDIQVSSGPDGQKTLVGRRNGLMALCYISGQLRLTPLKEDIVRIAELAREQRDTTYKLIKNGEKKMFYPLVFESLYLRPLFATAIGGTSQEYDEFEDFADTYGLLYRKQELTHFDSLVTVHDFVVESGVPPDFSKGTISVHEIYGVDDKQFDVILQEASQ